MILPATRADAVGLGDHAMVLISEPPPPALRSETLGSQVAALRAHAQEAARQLLDLCQEIALTADEVARVYDQLAATGSPATAARARVKAQRARRFAEHERREHRRWAAQPDVDARSAVSTEPPTN